MDKAGIDYELYVTMTAKDEKVETKIKQAFSEATIWQVENRGYDIGPFIDFLHKNATERLKEIDTLVSQSGIVLSGKYLNTTIQPDENGVLDLNALFVQPKVDNPPPSFIRREAIIATTANVAKTFLPLDGYKISSLPVSVEILTRAAQASSQVISFNTFEKDNFEYDENVVDFSNTGAKLKDNIAVESTLGDDGTYSVDLTQFNNLNEWRLI